jgi:hypothetical protein
MAVESINCSIDCRAGRTISFESVKASECRLEFFSLLSLIKMAIKLNRFSNFASLHKERMERERETTHCCQIDFASS